MYQVFLLYALFASIFTISKTGLQYAQPLFFVGARMLFAGVVLLAYQYLFRRGRFTFHKQDFWKIFLLALFNIYLTNACEFWGLKYLTSFKTCFIYSLSPFISALFSYIIFSEKITSKKWLGLIVGFAGLGPMLLSQTATEELTGTFFFLSWAEISVMAAAVSTVYGWILMRQLVRDRGYSPIMANGISMLLGGVMALGHSALVEEWNPLPLTEFGPFLLYTGLLIITSNIICYNLYGMLLKRYSATFMSFAGLTTPLFTAFFGWLFLGEYVSWPFYFSLTIVFLGLLIFHQEELKRQPAIS